MNIKNIFKLPKILPAPTTPPKDNKKKKKEDKNMFTWKSRLYRKGNRYKCTC